MNGVYVEKNKGQYRAKKRIHETKAHRNDDHDFKTCGEVFSPSFEERKSVMVPTKMDDLKLNMKWRLENDEPDYPSQSQDKNKEEAGE